MQGDERDTLHLAHGVQAVHISMLYVSKHDAIFTTFTSRAKTAVFVFFLFSGEALAAEDVMSDDDYQYSYSSDESDRSAEEEDAVRLIREEDVWSAMQERSSSLGEQRARMRCSPRPRRCARR